MRKNCLVINYSNKLFIFYILFKWLKDCTNNKTYIKMHNCFSLFLIHYISNECNIHKPQTKWTQHKPQTKWTQHTQTINEQNLFWLKNRIQFCQLEWEFIEKGNEKNYFFLNEQQKLKTQLKYLIFFNFQTQI